MKWTTKLPKKAGWYWCKGFGKGSQPCCIQVTYEDGVLMADTGIMKMCMAILKDSLLWAGPIPEPEENE